MSSKKQLALGAAGFVLLAWLAFTGMSALIGEEDVQLMDPPEPTSLVASLHVQLLDPRGEPPADCVVTLWKRVEGHLQVGPKTTGRCVGGDLGWTGLQPGGYLLEVAVPGASRYARNLELEPGDAIDLGVEELSPGGILEVTVLGPDGRGLPGAQVWLGNWLVQADIHGAYRFLGASLGKQIVRAQFDQVVKSETIELKQAGEKLQKEITLDALVVRGVMGVEFTATAEGIQITEVVSGGPAEGVLQVGDLLTMAAGLPALGLTQQQAESLLDGPPGQSVALSVTRDGQELALDVVRSDLIDVLTDRMKHQASLPPRMRDP